MSEVFLVKDLMRLVVTILLMMGLPGLAVCSDGYQYRSQDKKKLFHIRIVLSPTIQLSSQIFRGLCLIIESFFVHLQIGKNKPAMLEDIRENIKQLIARYEAEKAENERLRDELRACEETGATLRKQITELESELETRKLTEAFSAGAPADAKAKVDKLIKEIDKCISYLEEA